MHEINDLHKPFKEFLKKNNILYVCTNWNNHNRQGDEGKPDFIIPINNGQTIYIEFKTEEKFFSEFFGLKEKQREWRKYLIENKHLYFLTYTLISATTFIVAYMSEVKNEQCD